MRRLLMEPGRVWLFEDKPSYVSRGLRGVVHTITLSLCYRDVLVLTCSVILCQMFMISFPASANRRDIANTTSGRITMSHVTLCGTKRSNVLMMSIWTA